MIAIQRDSDGKTRERTVAGLFERQAAATPDRVAVSCNGEEIRYGQLDERASRIASGLARRGAGRGAIVGIHMRRGPNLIAAVLGVLKAGAAYLPLDPAYPAERLCFMLDDAGARLVVTDEGLTLPGCQATRVGRLLAESSRAVASPAGTSDLAYVIYTSGSSGVPKGVRTPHRAVLAYLAAMRRVEWVMPQDVMLAHSSLCFDASVPEILLPLVVGARTVLVSRETAADGAALRECVEREQVTAMFATPATWQMLVDAGWRGRRDFKAHCGGELYSVALAAEIHKRVGQLWNVYGPTETTVYATMHRLDSLDDGLPVGRPIAGYRAWVVDSRGCKAAPLVPGELLIGGPGVADGYLNRPELTDERFIADPSGQPGERVYRSGDLARLRPDGNLEILGRVDNQIKIRGYRIEPEEIETVLLRHDGVRQAVVGGWGETAAQRRLVAWLVARDGIDAARLRTFLKTRVPDYMVPSQFVFLPALPLTATGKVDRRALPEPVAATDGVEHTADLVEYQLCRIFEEVLDVRPVGVEQSFFELGGSSVSAVRLLARIEKSLGRRISLMDVFTSPSVADLAARLAQDGWRPTLAPLVALQPKGSRPPFFCVHALIGDVCRDLGRHSAVDQPFYGFQPRGLDGREEPLARVEDMAAAYISEMRRVQPSGPYRIGGFCFGGVVAFEMARQLERGGEQVALLAVIDSALPNLRPYATERLRSLVAAPRVTLEQWGRRLSEHPGESVASFIRRGLRRVWARQLMASGRAEKGLVEETARDILGTLSNFSRWPESYQTIARHNLMAMLQYVPGQFGGTVRLIRGVDESAWKRDGVDDWGWGKAAADVRVEEVAARHDEIMVEPHVRQVARVLDALLREQAMRGTACR